MAVKVFWYGSTAIRVLEGQVASRVKRAGGVLVQAVKEECPVDTGALQSTVRTEPGDNRLAVNVVVGDESRGVDYAKFVHDGTSRQRANPFIIRAVYRSMNQVRAALSGGGAGFFGGLRDVISRITGR